MCLVGRFLSRDHIRMKGYRLRCLKSTPGCTDLEACNYESAANEDDGSCDYSCQNYVDSIGQRTVCRRNDVLVQRRRIRPHRDRRPVLVPPQSRSTAFANGDDIPLLTGTPWNNAGSTASRPTACTAMTRSTPTNTGCTTTVGQRAMTAGCVPLVLLCL